MQRLNVEIKAKCANPEKIKAILATQNARFIGEDHQVDTYFNVPNGRLKLREGNIENALIHYERSNQSGPKQSNVLLYKSSPDSTLKIVLQKALGTLGVVDKVRSIYFIDNVKFHVDQVKTLGSFTEIEAIDKDGSIGYDQLLKQCQDFMQLLDIKQKDLVAVSYSDLIMAQ